MRLKTDSDVRLAAENIGGIEETSVDLSPGVNVLVGRNATNRTSFLQAVMAACGSTDVTLKSDADEGHVEMEFAGETYTRTLKRDGDLVRFEGSPFLEETTVADLFAFLLGSNEARQAIIQQQDLRDVVMRPVDTDEINSEIDRLESEKRRLDEQIGELENQEDRLPDLEREKRELEERLADKQVALEEKRQKVEAADADIDESRAEKSELESKLSELRSTRSDLESTRYDLETQQERLSSLEDELADIEDELEELSETPAGRLSEIEDDIERLRTEKRRAESDLSELQNVIQFNESRLEETDDGAFAAFDGGTETQDAVTDQLLEDETTTCWTCGSTVETEQIEETVDRLRELSQEKLTNVQEIESDLDDLEAEKRSLESEGREREQLERKRERTADQMSEAKSTIEDLEAEKQSLEQSIEDLEAEVRELESAEYEAVLERHREANQLEFEVEQIETDIADVVDEIDSIEERLDERSDIEAEREEIQSELTDLRTRIGRLESVAVESFNQNMETLLALLEYENVDRIWIERVEQEVRDGRRKVEKTAFELHVVRSSESGSAYEDTIETLSESEREVTGLVFGLAGYLTHEVYEECPFMLLDSLEAIDTGRIADLVEYFAEKVPYLVVALLPEDASDIENPDRRIESI